MATDRGTIDFILELLGDRRLVTARAMFGEYGLWCDGKTVGLICDDTLFVKDTPAARALLPDPELGPPYPKAKPYIIANALFDDAEALQALVFAIADDLPEPKPKSKSRKPRRKKAD